MPKPHEWAYHGCLELIAIRNCMVHNESKWNERSINIVKPFIPIPPKDGEKISIGIPMVFRYRKAVRTLVNESK